MQARAAAGVQQESAAASTPSPAQVVLGAPGRPVHGAAGGGSTTQESGQVATGDAAALGLQPMTGRAIAAHRLDVPASLPQASGGTWNITVDITPPAAPGFSIVLRISFSSPARQGEMGTVGRVLPLVVDPTRPDRVAIDPARLQ